jgi:hypothetical protein
VAWPYPSVTHVLTSVIELGWTYLKLPLKLLTLAESMKEVKKERVHKKLFGAAAVR